MDLKTIQIIGLKVREFAASDCSEALVQECECLAGCCAVCARTMQLILEELGQESTFVMASTRTAGHCWTELELHGQIMVIDTTATQFYCSDSDNDNEDNVCYADCPEVVIEPLSVYGKRSFVRKLKNYVQDQDALDSIRRGWTNQSPARYLGAIDEFVSQVVSDLRTR